MHQPRLAFLLPLLAALLSFASPAHGQTTTKPIGPNPDNTVTGRVDYVALGASFRATNGNTNACAVKSNSGGSVGGVYTGTENWWVAQREINGINAVLNAGDRTAAQRVPAGTAVRAGETLQVCFQAQIG